ncbi:MAG: hypothetical protein E7014_07040 [Alphaproteobacteria bacterium]|nr:hypothetical protein [Alphaproteobacteria bacterium]MBR3912951.1 peptidylprolyl isomerase [Alphaproteobacteria bacterium]
MKYGILLLSCILWIILPVFAGEIVAVVNDEPVSSYDVEARAKLIAIQKAQYLSNKRKAQYIEEALNAIIDDKVKITEAKRFGFSVKDSEIEDAISHLEQQNGLKSGEMVKMLAKNGVPVRILKDQIRADLMWIQVLQKQRSAISEATSVEIENKKKELRKELQKEEFYVFEILVPTKETAEECYKEILNGTDFDKVVAKYSIASSKETGGEVGWIDSKHYGKEITGVLRQLSAGEISVPLKTKKGYLLLLVQDRKIPITEDFVTIWELAQMAIPTEHAVKLEKQLIALNNCDKFLKFAKKYAIEESVKSGMMSPNQLPEELFDILKSNPTKSVIGPVRTADTDIFFMKCDVIKKQVLPEDSQIKMQIENEKMESLSDKILRNAKRFAVIERK